MPGLNLAVIEDLKNRRQWLLHEGDRARDILIKEIRTDSIVINAGNGDESVKIRGFLGGHLELPLEQATMVAHPGNQTGYRHGYFLIDRAAAEAEFSNPVSALNRVDILPARLFNRKTGFRIANFDSESLFKQMGLRSGDLVLKINDREITGPEEAASVLEIIGLGGEVDLTVRRRARTYRIHLQVR
jgi:type II secretion system protein C